MRSKMYLSIVLLFDVSRLKTGAGTMRGTAASRIHEGRWMTSQCEYDAWLLSRGVFTRKKTNPCTYIQTLFKYKHSLLSLFTIIQ